MTIREAVLKDRHALQAAFNENAKIAGWCVSGARDLSLDNLDRIRSGDTVFVHENSSGKVDAWISWNERGREPQVTTLTGAPTDPVALIAALAALCLRMCEELQAKGHSLVIAELDPRKTTVIRFLFKIGGTVRWRAFDSSKKLYTAQLMEFKFSEAIPALQKLVG